MTKHLEISSAFKVKGTAFSNVKNFIEIQLGIDQYEELISSHNLNSPRNPIKSSWYSASDFVHLEVLAAERLNLSLREFCIRCTTFILEEDLNGVYRFFIKLGGPDRVMASVPRIARTYNNLFNYHIQKNEKGLHNAYIIHPPAVYDWAIGSCEGGLRGILNVCKMSLKSFREVGSESYLEEDQKMMKTYFEMIY